MKRLFILKYLTITYVQLSQLLTYITVRVTKRENGSFSFALPTVSSDYGTANASLGNFEFCFSCLRLKNLKQIQCIKDTYIEPWFLTLEQIVDIKDLTLHKLQITDNLLQSAGFTHEPDNSVPLTLWGIPKPWIHVAKNTILKFISPEVFLSLH